VTVAGRASAGETVTPSLLDRLIDDEPDRKSDSTKRPADAAHEFRASVQRDTENLLNTRRRWPAVRGIPDLAPSCLDYGIPDPTGLDLSTPELRESFRQEVEKTLLMYEPRFRSVRVSFPENDDAGRTVHFRVDAVLDMDPVPEPLTLDSVLDPSDGSVRVGK
jgi:type VI secretion system protein ImpF